MIKSISVLILASLVGCAGPTFDLRGLKTARPPVDPIVAAEPMAMGEAMGGVAAVAMAQPRDAPAPTPDIYDMSVIDAEYNRLLPTCSEVMTYYERKIDRTRATAIGLSMAGLVTGAGVGIAAAAGLSEGWMAVFGGSAGLFSGLQSTLDTQGLSKRAAEDKAAGIRSDYEKANKDYIAALNDKNGVAMKVALTSMKSHCLSYARSVPHANILADQAAP